MVLYVFFDIWNDERDMNGISISQDNTGILLNNLWQSNVAGGKIPH